MFEGIPALCSLEASKLSPPQPVTSKNVSCYCQMSPEGEIAPSLSPTPARPGATDLNLRCEPPHLGLIQDPVTHTDALYLL